MSEPIASEQVPRTRRAKRKTSLIGMLVGAAMFAGGIGLGVWLVVESMSAAGAPSLPLANVAFCAGFGLIGLSMTWFYLAAFLEGRAAGRLPILDTRPELPVLPEGPLRFARRYRASSLQGVTFLGACALFFAGLTLSQWPEGGLGAASLGSAAMAIFLAAMTGVLVLLAAALVRASFRQASGIARASQAWATVSSFEVADMEGVDVGNRVLKYTSPFSSKPASTTVGAMEAAPWIVDGSVLVVCDEGRAAEYIVRNDGGPFDLSESQIARFVS